MKNIKAIFIIAWHSKFNPWAENNWLIERDLVKEISTDLYNKIKNVKDIDIILIWIDEVSLESKTELVNKICKDNWYTLENSLLIEVHTNAWWGTWIESLIYDWYDPAYNLSKDLIINTIKTTWLKNRWVKEWKQLYIIKNTIPLAIIFECGFIDTEKDRKVLKSNIISFSDWLYNWLKQYIWFKDLSEVEILRKENIKLKEENKIFKEKLEKIKNIV